MTQEVIDSLIPPMSTPSFEEDRICSESAGGARDAEIFVQFDVFIRRPPKKGQKGPIPLAPLNFKQPRSCSVTINTCETTLEAFQDMLVAVMNKRCPNLGDVVLADTNSELSRTEWIITLTNSRQGMFNRSKKIHLDSATFEQWTREIERSKRGRASIIIKQNKPGDDGTEPEVPADHQAAVQQELQRQGTLANRGGSGQDSQSDDRHSNQAPSASPPLNDFALAATVRNLHNTHRMAGHLHRGFPIYRNPINPNEGIILTGSTMTIWAEAIINKEAGVDLKHPPSTLTYRKLKKRKNNDPPSPV
ncbi:hypothetical protein PGT21_009909 [Puccinia graminis f. sp. tritici]|uniref:Uncharacterized protein n=1 Tax=Puccinia graminis f. sp. tritici TaxID=56615 RepID=A0A5B0PTY3_PUCGR|nr:hypothetical protein PGT21_009909 [Puccinia graminis f. sp. tritici]KAA1128252.1 hypothetical protein PGTUg99_017183 [Puccinia graminis f. sp. tritici]